jgi:aminoglycoside 2''-phosphotransferase
MMMSLDQESAQAQAHAEIVRAFPDFNVRDIRLLGSGVDSDAYLVNGEWVFRFPRRQVASLGLGREVALLPQLAEVLPVPIPHFEYVATRPETDLMFVGYRLIPGEPLTRKLFDSLSAEAQERVFATLAAFLKAVHAFDPRKALAAGVEHLPTRNMIGDVWKATSGRVLARMSKEDGRALSDLISGFRMSMDSSRYRQRLLYADFAPEHILYDRAADRITGIIDWGDMAIGDPDYDQTYLYQDYGSDFIRRLLVYLPHAHPDRLFTKLRVFCAYDYLMDVLANDGPEPTPEAQTAVDEALAGLHALAHGF